MLVKYLNILSKILVIYTIKVYLSTIYCSNYDTDKYSIWRNFFQNRSNVNRKYILICPRYKYDNVFLFNKMSNIYSVSDDIQTISPRKSLYVSLSLKSDHFLMSAPIEKSVNYTELDAIFNTHIIAQTIINSFMAIYTCYIQIQVLLLLLCYKYMCL